MASMQILYANLIQSANADRQHTTTIPDLCTAQPEASCLHHHMEIWDVLGILLTQNKLKLICFHVKNFLSRHGANYNNC